ncbi:MAG: hypothetical protein ACKOQY_02260 [Bacteroidota bacterium]
MAPKRPASNPSLQLYLLPKDKPMLDYVLNRLAETLSPEKYEIVESIFQMYRTSAGFDPSVMAKVRFKRLKAGEFKQALAEIDTEIGSIIQSEGYQLELARLGGPEPLFQTYIELSKESVVGEPMKSLEEFGLKCEATDSIELFLLFYRQHARMIEQHLMQDQPHQLLAQYDSGMERLRQLHRQFRISLELHMLEHDPAPNSSDQEKVGNFLEELGALLTLEPDTNRKLVLITLLFRAASLSELPGKHIRPYLDYLAANAEAIFTHSPESRKYVLGIMAHYHVQAGKVMRMSWLEEAEKIVRVQDQGDDRIRLRFIRASIESDSGNSEQALKHLNEVEHLLHKSPSKTPAIRNYWVRLCEMKTLLYATQILNGQHEVMPQLVLLQQTAEDQGSGRQDSAVVTLEWRALEQFLNRKPEEALRLFNKALEYRNERSLNPWLLIDRYFSSLLNPQSGPGAAATEALLMKELQEPFFSAACERIFELAAATVPSQAQQE